MSQLNKGPQIKTHTDFDDEDNQINHEENLLDQNPEFQKLGLLNSHLNNDMISKSEKIMLIYHQILEELHEGCWRNQNILNQEEKIEKSSKANTLASGTIQTFKDGLKRSEKEFVKQMLINLELSKESDRIKE